MGSCKDLLGEEAVRLRERHIFLSVRETSLIEELFQFVIHRGIRVYALARVVRKATSVEVDMKWIMTSLTRTYAVKVASS